MAESIILKKLKAIAEKYAYYVRESGLKLSPGRWVMIALFFSLLIAFAALMVNLSLLGMRFGDLNAFKLPLILLIVALDLTLGYPYLLATQKITKIEDAFPDALKQIADTLRAGGTYEFAIREVSTAGYGPLSEEMDNVLRSLEEGQSFQQAMENFSDRIESTIVKRTITIINQAMRAGAGLADVLDDVADDVKEMNMIERERKAKTMMQVMFIVMAGAIVAPAIFGMVNQIISFLISSTLKSSITGAAAVGKALNVKETITTLMEAYIAIESLVSSVIISLMREGKATKSILYFPILLLIAFTIYVVGGIIIQGMLITA
ncbi:type II secretion system F family protein [archaeon]|nr:type II secretion system F family protein [archaeon]